MAVKITNTNPVNNGQVQLGAGNHITATGRADETCTVLGWLDNGGIKTMSDEVGVPVPAGGNWTLHFAATVNTFYSMTVQGQNSNGNGSSTILIQVVAALVAPPNGNGAVQATQAAKRSEKTGARSGR